MTPYYVSGLVSDTTETWFHLFFIATLQSNYFSAHFTHEKSETLIK